MNMSERKFDFWTCGLAALTSFMMVGCGSKPLTMVVGTYTDD